MNDLTYTWRSRIITVTAAKLRFGDQKELRQCVTSIHIWFSAEPSSCAALVSNPATLKDLSLSYVSAGPDSGEHDKPSDPDGRVGGAAELPRDGVVDGRAGAHLRGGDRAADHPPQFPLLAHQLPQPRFPRHRAAEW